MSKSYIFKTTDGDLISRNDDYDYYTNFYHFAKANGIKIESKKIQPEYREQYIINPLSQKKWSYKRNKFKFYSHYNISAEKVYNPKLHRIVETDETSTHAGHEIDWNWRRKIDNNKIEL